MHTFQNWSSTSNYTAVHLKQWPSTLSHSYISLACIHWTQATGITYIQVCFIDITNQQTNHLSQTDFGHNIRPYVSGLKGLTELSRLSKKLKHIDLCVSQWIFKMSSCSSNAGLETPALPVSESSITLRSTPAHSPITHHIKSFTSCTFV